SSKLSASAAGTQNGTCGGTKPDKSIPERKRRAAREVEKASPEMTDRIIAGDIKILKAQLELREECKLDPARIPAIALRATESTPREPAPAPPATGEAGALGHLPVESGTALADYLVSALGIEQAMTLLRDALAAIEARVKKSAGPGPAGADAAQLAEQPDD